MWLSLVLVAHAAVVKIVLLPNGKAVGTPGYVTSANDGYCTSYGGDACKEDCQQACTQPSACLQKAERLRVAARAAIPPDSDYDAILLITPQFEHVKKKKLVKEAAAVVYVGSHLKGYGLEYEVFEPSYEIASECDIPGIRTGGRLGSSEAIPLVLAFIDAVPAKGKKPLMLFSTGNSFHFHDHLENGECLRKELDKLEERVLVIVSGDLSQNHQPSLCNAPYTFTGHGMLRTGAAPTNSALSTGEPLDMPANHVPDEFDRLLRSWPATMNWYYLNYAKDAIEINNGLQIWGKRGRSYDAIRRNMSGGLSGDFPVSAITGMQVLQGLIHFDLAHWAGTVTAYEVPTYTGMMVATWTWSAQGPVGGAREEGPDDPGSDYPSWSKTLVPGPTTSPVKPDISPEEFGRLRKRQEDKDKHLRHHHFKQRHIYKGKPSTSLSEVGRTSHPIRREARAQ